MERGELGTQSNHFTVFVFEDLIAQLDRPRAERIALKLRHWDSALSCWTFDYRVLDFISRFLFVYDMPVRVVTWHPSGFARELHDKLWEMQCQVTETVATTYKRISQLYATDSDIITVYDADPDHRFGYGFKCRDYTGAQ